MEPLIQPLVGLPTDRTAPHRQEPEVQRITATEPLTRPLVGLPTGRTVLLIQLLAGPLMDRTAAPAQLSVQQHTATDSGDLTQVSSARRVRQLLANVRQHGARKRKTLLQAVRDKAAEPVVKKVHRRGTPAAPINGLFEVDHGGHRRVVEYEPDSELRDTEQIPLPCRKRAALKASCAARCSPTRRMRGLWARA